MSYKLLVILVLEKIKSSCFGNDFSAGVKTLDHDYKDERTGF